MYIIYIIYMSSILRMIFDVLADDYNVIIYTHFENIEIMRKFIKNIDCKFIIFDENVNHFEIQLDQINELKLEIATNEVKKFVELFYYKSTSEIIKIVEEFDYKNKLFNAHIEFIRYSDDEYCDSDYFDHE